MSIESTRPTPPPERRLDRLYEPVKAPSGMALRIEETVLRPAAVAITVDGSTIGAFPGESLAAALFAAGWRELRTSPRAGAPRGMFCLMGACQECAVNVDGQRVTACTEPVRAGMVVLTGAGR